MKDISVIQFEKKKYKKNTIFIIFEIFTFTKYFSIY